MGRIIYKQGGETRIELFIDPVNEVMSVKCILIAAGNHTVLAEATFTFEELFGGGKKNVEG